MKGADIEGEQEEIDFLERISPREFKSHVEQWLARVEEEMIHALKATAAESLDERRLNKIPYIDWLRKWPGQMIICLS